MKRQDLIDATHCVECDKNEKARGDVSGQTAKAYPWASSSKVFDDEWRYGGLDRGLDRGFFVGMS